MLGHGGTMARKRLSPEDFAREALRGFFSDPNGFKDMSRGPRKEAVKRVERLLATLEETQREDGQGGSS